MLLEHIFHKRGDMLALLCHDKGTVFEFFNIGMVWYSISSIILCMMAMAFGQRFF